MGLERPFFLLFSLNCCFAYRSSVHEDLFFICMYVSSKYI